MNADASTHENNDANTYFTSGKAAMVQMFPFVIKDFEKALGKNLGLARLPQSGPNPGRTAANSFHNWVIPKNAGNKDRCVGVHQDGGRQPRARRDLATTVGALPTNKVASATDQGPDVEVLPRSWRRIRSIPLLDSVVPLKVALLYYQQLQAAFSGKTTPPQGDAERRQGTQVAEPLTTSHDTRRLGAGPTARSGCGASLYAAPAVVLVSIFVAYPFGSILYHAFTRWDGHQPVRSGSASHNFRCSGTTRSSAPR